MVPRPLSVTVVAWLFVTAGTVGFAYHATELNAQTSAEDVWVLGLRLLAILAGAWVLRGADWARWLLLAWIAYHVALSAFHPLSELITHAVLLVVVAYILLRAPASAYFRRTR